MTRLNGWLDHLRYAFDTGWVLTGWAADMDDLGRRLKVRILHDRETLKSTVADIYREDLREAGVGGGRHGFQTNIPINIMTGFKEIDISLAVEDPEMTVIVTRTFVVDSPTGRLEGLVGMVAVGWAFDPSNPSAPVSLDMVVDGVLAGRIDADQYREDLATSGWGSHGFQWLLPEAYIDGAPHRLAAHFTNNAQLIVGEVPDFRLCFEQLPADVRRHLEMRSAALAQVRSLEQLLFSEGRRLRPKLMDPSSLLDRLLHEPDIEGGASAARNDLES
jgi:hypothetical protein